MMNDDLLVSFRGRVVSVFNLLGAFLDIPNTSDGDLAIALELVLDKLTIISKEMDDFYKGDLV